VFIALASPLFLVAGQYGETIFGCQGNYPEPVTILPNVILSHEAYQRG
jgi:hypothetical protein